MVKLKSYGFPKVKPGDIVWTEEARACWDKGMCGETLVQKTRYRIVLKGNQLMALCLDYGALRYPKDLKSWGQSWERTGYRKEKYKGETNEQNGKNL